jgi:hypothetical protein
MTDQEAVQHSALALRLGSAASPVPVVRLCCFQVDFVLQTYQVELAQAAKAGTGEDENAVLKRVAQGIVGFGLAMEPPWNRQLCCVCVLCRIDSNCSQSTLTGQHQCSLRQIMIRMASAREGIRIDTVPFRPHGMAGLFIYVCIRLVLV